MVETFAQVWFLCAAAFAAGSAATWLLFVRRRPRRLTHPLFPPTPPRRHQRALGLPRLERTAPLEPPAPTEPALANLDTHRAEGTSRRAGPSAAGALDRLGVARGARAPDSAQPSDIPAQGGPVDE